MDNGMTGFLTGLSQSLSNYISNKNQSQLDQQKSQADSDRDLQKQEALYQFQKSIDAKYADPNADPNRPTTVNTGNLKRIPGFEKVETMFGANKDIALSDMETVHKALNPNSGGPNTHTVPASFASSYLQGLGVDQTTADAQAQAAQKSFGSNIPMHVLDGIGKAGGQDLKDTNILKQFEMAHTDPKTGKASYTKSVPSWGGMSTTQIPMTQQEIKDGVDLLKDSIKNTGNKPVNSIDELDDLTHKSMALFDTLTTDPQKGGKGLDTLTATAKVVNGLKRQGYSKLAISKITRNIVGLKANSDQMASQQPQQPQGQPQIPPQMLAQPQGQTQQRPQRQLKPQKPQGVTVAGLPTNPFGDTSGQQ